ncbi:hypothetical protein [Streptomyces sp. TRM49041]|uniref:hypothetical protein n=1 Tax=Streptomyces sp. TRM49041 TaxID=2603216 RepID=UPI001656844F|nr:hypothetical protein [Streptomyces sp. TRM49041]
MRPQERPPLPALTRAEGAYVDGYLDIVDLVGRLNPARATHTYGAMRAAQALARQAVVLRDALTLMHRWGEHEIHDRTLARALRALDGERRTGRVTLPQDRLE